MEGLASCGGAGEGRQVWERYDFIRLINNPLKSSDCCLPRLTMKLIDLIEFLGDVGLDELEICLVRRKKLSASLRI